MDQNQPPQVEPVHSGDQPISTPPVIPPNSSNSHKALILSAIVLVVLLAGGAAFALYKSQRVILHYPVPQAGQGVKIGEEDLANITLPKGLFDIEEEIKFKDNFFAVTLAEGKGDQPIRISGSAWIGQFAFGELTGDTFEDAVAVVGVHLGGTGTFKHLVVFENQNGQPEYVAHAYLGDRTIINSISISNKIVVLDLTVHGPDDGLCCPSMPKKVFYSLVNKKLIEAN